MPEEEEQQEQMDEMQEPDGPEQVFCIICQDEDRPLVEDSTFLDRDGADGWGYTKCCFATCHYECLVPWLNPHAETCGSDGLGQPVSIQKGCPICKEPIKRIKARMLGAK